MNNIKHKLALKGYKLKIVLLDAGHGGIINGVYQTAGKRSPIWDDGTQYFEGFGNRLIRMELIKLLENSNISYHLVNESHEDMSLGKRIKIINSLSKKFGVKNTLCISIHSNGFKDEQAHGWSCYTSPNQTASDLYATALYDEVPKVFEKVKLRKAVGDGDPDIEARFALLVKTICPAILSENFFHTNKKECKEILMKRKGRKMIAKAHFNMIQKLINC